MRCHPLRDCAVAGLVAACVSGVVACLLLGRQHGGNAELRPLRVKGCCGTLGGAHHV